MASVIIIVMRFPHHPDPPVSLITLTPPLSAVRYGGGVWDRERQGGARYTKAKYGEAVQSTADLGRGGQCRALQGRAGKGTN